MTRPFNDAHLAFRIRTDNRKWARGQSGNVGRIDTEIAVVLFGSGRGAIERGDLRARLQGQSHDAPDQRARKFRDEQTRSVRIVLGVLCVVEPEDVASIFEDHMLKTAAGCEQRNGAFPSKANRRQCSGD